MIISRLNERLEQVKEREGDIEVTCTHSTVREKPEDPFSRTFEATVENVTIEINAKGGLTKRVRLWI